jgi:hypothetical protein
MSASIIPRMNGAANYSDIRGSDHGRNSATLLYSAANDGNTILSSQPKAKPTASITAPATIPGTTTFSFLDLLLIFYSFIFLGIASISLEIGKYLQIAEEFYSNLP